jgi:hypothetical protein
MPKGKTAATVETREPNEAYDHLTQKDKDAHDEIGRLGYKPEQGSSGLWLARHRVQTTITVGPCQSLDVLLGRLQDEIADDVAPGPDPDEEAEAEFDNQIDEPETPDADADHPDGFLFEEMKPTHQKACPPLATAILNYEGYKSERMTALAKEVEAKQEVTGLMRANRDKLAFDPKTGIRSYRVNDYIEELVPGEEKLKSRRVSDEDDE